ncbi:MAG: baseplate J/gp47 family protein [Synergistaceae bacterium]|nr:baseplate J/gp47 family protein [Synergistaceae bacterium]MBQ9628383.1 baseplate J/gp47 family protein [Synergistaceae bacterium]MBR0251230.1 baseplate J/gp47 family protein [Synergistaceae bacterium]
MKSELFNYLEDVNFAEKDPALIESEIISMYESITNRTLSRGDPVRLFLNAIILAMIQQRNIIDIAAKNNLLAYASGSYLDHIGAMLGVSRLSASRAVSTCEFTLSTAQNFYVFIYEGMRVSAGDGLTFSVTEEGEIPPGNLTCTCTVMCTEAGEKGNGYVPGQINRINDILPYIMSVRNITESNGGSDVESDENFRERIHIAPESFSSAGPVNAYAYYARTAHNDIIDVAVLGPPDTQPGHVEIYPLMTGGELPGDEILESVYKTCNAEDIRPDTDYVSVKKPEVLNYAVNVHYWIDERNSAGSYAIQNKVLEAIHDWEKWTRIKLGRDINISELTKRIILAGAKRCVINSPEFTAMKKNQIAVVTDEMIIYGGLEEA